MTSTLKLQEHARELAGQLGVEPCDLYVEQSKDGYYLLIKGGGTPKQRMGAEFLLQNLLKLPLGINRPLDAPKTCELCNWPMKVKESETSERKTTSTKCSNLLCPNARNWMDTVHYKKEQPSKKNKPLKLYEMKWPKPLVIEAQKESWQTPKPPQEHWLEPGMLVYNPNAYTGICKVLNIYTATSTSRAFVSLRRFRDDNGEAVGLAVLESDFRQLRVGDRFAHVSRTSVITTIDAIHGDGVSITVGGLGRRSMHLKELSSWYKPYQGEKIEQVGWLSEGMYIYCKHSYGGIYRVESLRRDEDIVMLRKTEGHAPESLQYSVKAIENRCQEMRAGDRFEMNTGGVLTIDKYDSIRGNVYYVVDSYHLMRHIALVSSGCTPVLDEQPEHWMEKGMLVYSKTSYTGLYTVVGVDLATKPGFVTLRSLSDMVTDTHKLSERENHFCQFKDGDKFTSNGKCYTLGDVDGDHIGVFEGKNSFTKTLTCISKYFTPARG